MNALPPTSFTAAGPLLTAGLPESRGDSARAPSMKWSALHDAVGVVAMLAGMATEPVRPEISNYPAMMRDVGGWRRELAEQGIADLSAIMEPGITALIAVHAGGANPAPAALALWQEFHAARSALLALAPEQGAPGNR